METKQKSNWRLTCRFDVFAQSYTGLKKRSDVIDFITENDQIFNLRFDQFLTKEDLNILWDEYVDIQYGYTIENNGIQCLTIETIVAGQEYNLECDCMDVKKLLRSIINKLKY